MITRMKEGAPSYWWVPLIFGVAFLLIGWWMLSKPEASFETIIRFIGVIILVSGVVQSIFTLLYRRLLPGWGYQAAGDLFDVLVGVLLILDPGILLTLITIFVAIWLIVNAITLFMWASAARRDGRRTWYWEFGLGVLLIILALFFLWHPMTLGFTIAIWTGLAFVFLGGFRIILTLRLHSQRSKIIKEQKEEL